MDVLKNFMNYLWKDIKIQGAEYHFLGVEQLLKEYETRKNIPSQERQLGYITAYIKYKLFSCILEVVVFEGEGLSEDLSDLQLELIDEYIRFFIEQNIIK